MAKNIIFDWSGVIKDALKSHLWVVNRMFRRLRASEISLKDLKKNWEQPYMLFYNKYLPNLTIEEEQIAYKEAILHKDCPESEAFPGITELLKKLKQNQLFMAIITSDFSETILPEIKKYDLEKVFDDIITDIHDKRVAINDLIKKHKLNPKETFFVGDSNHEIEAGKQVGVKTIAVTWGFSTKQKLKSMNPDFIVNNTDELEKIFVS